MTAAPSDTIRRLGEAPEPALLDPAERMGLDELRALQLERLQWTLRYAYGNGLFTGGLGAHYGAEKLGCTVIPISGGMTPRQVQLITDFEPRIIMVTPSYMLTVIDEFEKQGLDPRGSSLRIGIFGAEPWTEQMRREMEDRLDIQAVDIYGLSEVMGPGVAQECVETKDGLHIWE